MAAIRWGFATVALCLAISPAPGATTPVQPQVLASGTGGARATITPKYAIQVYDASGQLVRELALADFLSKDYVDALRRSADGSGMRFEARSAGSPDSVEFSLPFPGAVAGSGEPRLRFSIDLRDGSVRTTQIREYLAAVDQARTLATATTARQRTAKPLVASAALPTR